MLDALQTLNLLDLLTAGHLLGLVIGFGAVLCIDVVLINGYLTIKWPYSGMAFCQTFTRLVRIGLYMLWLTGLSLVFYYFVNSPEKLQSSVLQAKMIVVVILTLDSVVIHRKALPIVWKYRARNVLANSNANETALFAICLAVSLVSWCFLILFAFNLGFEQQSVAQLLSQYFFVLIIVVPFSCAIAFRARLNIRASSLLTYQDEQVISQA